MDQTGSRDPKLWFSDGANYPGQDSIRARQDRLAGALATVYGRLCGHQRLILEYTLFEPAFYTTDVPDWVTSYAHCVQLGDRAKVCVDTGHQAPGTNIEFIVAFLLRAGQARRLRLQFPLLRRRRPHRRRRGPVPAVPDPVRGDLGRRAPRGRRDRVHARPVPQHRAEDSRSDPLGDERPGGHGQGTARRRRHAGRRAAGRRCARRARCADGRVQYRRPAAARRTPRRAGPGPGPDGGVRRLRVRGKIAAERVGGQQAGWGA